jgi:hypothetical protein
VYGPARYWWAEKSSECDGDRRPDISLDAWRRLSKAEREAVEAEAISLPLPGLNCPITVCWAGSRSSGGPRIPGSNADGDDGRYGLVFPDPP